MKKSCLSAVYVFALTWTAFAANDVTSADPVTRDITVRGQYLEARTSDVWTGPCFANGEVNLMGKEGILAWSVSEGGWDGVPLAGLKVVAVVRANSTLGDPFAADSTTRSVIVVDEKATQEQGRALVRMAQSLGGDLLQNLVWVRTAAVTMDISRQAGSASLKAGEYAEIRTRPLNHHDMHCGNEFEYYPPLASGTQARPAYALANRFEGEGLNTTWSCPLKRSAFVGTFAR
jgi:hypothetical protein